MAEQCESACYQDNVLLLRNLLNYPNYSSIVSPSTGSNKPTIIYSSFFIVKLLELSNGGLMNVVAAMVLGWLDPRLGWNPEDYHNLTITELPPSAIWTPKLVLVNGVSENLLVPLDNRTIAAVDYEGHVTLNLNGQFRVKCNVDLKYFPFDRQNCTLTFVSTDLRKSAVGSLRFSTFPDFSFQVATAFYSTSGEFTLLNVSVTTDISRNEALGILLPSWDVNLHFQRNPDYYANNVAIPSLLLIVASALVFMIPSDNSVKITMASSLMIALYVLQQNTARLLPATKDAPMLATGLLYTLWLGGFTVMCAAVTVALRYWQLPLPACFAKLAEHCHSDLRKKEIIQIQNTSDNKLSDCGEKEIGDEGTVVAAVLLLVRCLQAERDERLAAAVKRAEISKCERQWRRLDFLINFVLLLIYLALAVNFCTQFFNLFRSTT